MFKYQEQEINQSINIDMQDKIFISIRIYTMDLIKEPK